MQVEKTDLKGVLLIKPKVFGDERGFFFESFNQNVWQEKTGLDTNFAQDNHSRSVKGVLRGLHYQSKQTQAKLVRVIEGEIFDVAVDLRSSSPTFKKWYGTNLSGENKKQLFIPEGFAHGFITLSDVAEVLYKASDYYAPEYDNSIKWDDAEIGIKWPMKPTKDGLSVKDAAGMSLDEALESKPF
jgi:dTDP-4-dehydrorhamnose 3,5-epimerase